MEQLAPAFHGACLEDALVEFAVTDADVDRIAAIPQRTLEWKEARKWRLTASNFAAAADHNPYPGSSPSELVARMLWDTFQGNAATEWGTKHEPIACATYEAWMRDRHPDFVVRESGLRVIKELPFVGVSPDGICSYWDAAAGKRETFLLEIKCPYRWKADAFYFGHVPTYYYDQIQGIMGLLGLPFADFVVWTPAGMEVNRVTFDDAYFQYLRDRLVAWYATQFYPVLCGWRAGEIEQGSLRPAIVLQEAEAPAEEATA